MIYVFDLDDTLYEELLYVRSGYSQVAEYLAGIFSLNRKKLFEEMLDLLKTTRLKMFDRVLISYNLYSKSRVKDCLSVYRRHTPKIQLYPDARLFLKSLKGYPIYLVTDGNKLVQGAKVKALGLEKYFKKIFFTSNYGLQNAKPSPYCFLKICELEKTTPRNITYIGDNPYKDFVSLNRLGFNTIRILRGNYANIKLDKQFEGIRNIQGYNELENI